MAWLRAVMVAGATLVVLSLGATAARAEASPFPVGYDKSRIVLGEERSISLPGGLGEATARWYSNPGYRCGRSGHFSLLVVEPDGTGEDERAPLWVMLHGGGVGYYDAGGEYHKAEAMNDEESIDDLLGVLRNKIEAGSGALKDNVVARRLAEGWRVMFPAMCDHDLYAGLGGPYPNNPNWGAGGDTVDGLPATMAAIDFTVRGNAVQRGHPSEAVILHGQSAGAVGAYVAAYAFEQAGIAINGAVLDAYLVSERLEALFAAGITPQQLTDPEGDYPPNLNAKIGPFVSDPSLFAEQTVAAGLQAPLYDIVGSEDPFCAGQLDPVPEAVEAGYDSNCRFVHGLLADAIEARPGRLHRSLVVPGAGHQPTNRPGPVNDAVDRWLEQVLASNSSSPWPPDTTPPEPKRCGRVIRGTRKGERLKGTRRSEAVHGRGGADRIRALGGDDCIRAGPGRDRVRAGAGDDVIRVFGGGRDRVRCGPGGDVVRASRGDRVDRRSCEVVKRRR